MTILFTRDMKLRLCSLGFIIWIICWNVSCDTILCFNCRPSYSLNHFFTLQKSTMSSQLLKSLITAHIVMIIVLYRLCSVFHDCRGSFIISKYFFMA